MHGEPAVHQHTCAHSHSWHRKQMTLSHAMRMQGAEDDVEMADAPDDFLDPITYTVMQDPVKLPSGAVMDRPNVLRMLLSDPRDPTTR